MNDTLFARYIFSRVIVFEIIKRKREHLYTSEFNNSGLLDMYKILLKSVIVSSN
jgi:hypothetical protein